MDSKDGGPVIKRAEIDTRAPFRSVKEAVALFGEKVLAGEVYFNKLKEMQGVASDDKGNGTSRNNSSIGTVTAELEETKQNLQKAKEESMFMENCLSSLKQELERTKRELEQIKERESEKQMIEFEIQDVKTVHQDSTKFHDVKTVTFAPSLAHVIDAPKGVGVEALERHPSLRKKKKKPLIPLIGGLFSKKKGSHERVQ